MKKISLLLLVGVFGLSTAYADNNRPNGPRIDFSKQCQGKALNSKLTLKNDGRTMTGTCALGFTPNANVQLERGAMRDPAVQAACKGKTLNQNVSVKISGKTVAGKCAIRFMPERPNRP